LLAAAPDFVGAGDFLDRLEANASLNETDRATFFGRAA
jgi:hypothetical protein